MESPSTQPLETISKITKKKPKKKSKKSTAAFIPESSSVASSEPVAVQILFDEEEVAHYIAQVKVYFDLIHQLIQADQNCSNAINALTNLKVPNGYHPPIHVYITQTIQPNELILNIILGALLVYNKGYLQSYLESNFQGMLNLACLHDVPILLEFFENHFPDFFDGYVCCDVPIEEMLPLLGVKAQSQKVIKYLIEHNSFDVNAKLPSLKETPLHYAVTNHYPRFTEYLLSNGALCLDDEIDSILLNIISMNRHQILDGLMAHFREQLLSYFKKEEAHILALVAQALNHPEMAQRIKGRPVSLLERTTPNQYNVAHAIAISGHTNALLSLQKTEEFRDNPDLLHQFFDDKTTKGQTPLMLALSLGHSMCAEKIMDLFFIKKSLPLTQKDYQNRHLGHYLALNPSRINAIAPIFADSAIAVLEKDIQGNTMLDVLLSQEQVFESTQRARDEFIHCCLLKLKPPKSDQYQKIQTALASIKEIHELMAFFGRYVHLTSEIDWLFTNNSLLLELACLDIPLDGLNHLKDKLFISPLIMLEKLIRLSDFHFELSVKTSQWCHDHKLLIKKQINQTLENVITNGQFSVLCYIWDKMTDNQKIKFYNIYEKNHNIIDVLKNLNLVKPQKTTQAQPISIDSIHVEKAVPIVTGLPIEDQIASSTTVEVQSCAEIASKKAISDAQTQTCEDEKQFIDDVIHKEKMREDDVFHEEMMREDDEVHEGVDHTSELTTTSVKGDFDTAYMEFLPVADDEIKPRFYHIPKFNNAFRKIQQSMIELGINLNAYVFGSAMYTIPADMDIVFPDVHIFDETSKGDIYQLVRELCKKHRALIVSNDDRVMYGHLFPKKSPERHAVDLVIDGVKIDFILTPEPIEMHAISLDYTISALYLEVKSSQLYAMSINGLFKSVHDYQHGIIDTIMLPDYAFNKDLSILFRAVRLAANDTRFKFSEVCFNYLKFLFQNPNVNPFLSAKMSGDIVQKLEKIYDSPRTDFMIYLLNDLNVLFHLMNYLFLNEHQNSNLLHYRACLSQAYTQINTVPYRVSSLNPNSFFYPSFYPSLVDSSIQPGMEANMGPRPGLPFSDSYPMVFK